MGKVRKTALIWLGNNIFVMILVLVLVNVLFHSLNQNYFTFRNMMNVMYATSIVGMLAIGLTYLMIAGHIDLSCGAIAALSAIIVASILRDTAIEAWPIALLISLGVAFLFGALNAVLVNVFLLQPFIATLAVSSICTGFSYIISNGRAIVITNQQMIAIGIGRVFDVPISAIVFVALSLLFGWILSRTVYGRSVYMIGGNKNAAQLAGMKPRKITSILYIQCAMIASLAGFITAARMHSAMPGAVSGLEFNAITAAVLGGVAFSGGRGNMLGCFIGLLIIQCFTNGLTTLGVNAFWQVVAQGTLLIAALIFDFIRVKQIEPRIHMLHVDADEKEG